MHEFNGCSAGQSLLAVASSDRKFRVRRGRLSFCSRFNALTLQRAVRQRHRRLKRQIGSHFSRLFGTGNGNERVSNGVIRPNEN